MPSTAGLRDAHAAIQSEREWLRADAPAFGAEGLTSDGGLHVLIPTYELEVFTPPCDPGAERFSAIGAPAGGHPSERCPT